jgi:hypothetical protein
VEVAGLRPASQNPFRANRRIRSSARVEARNWNAEQGFKEFRRASDIPYCFEAGTPNIEGVIGLAAGIEYVEGLGYDAIGRHEAALVEYAKRQLATLESVRSYGPKVGELSAPLVPFVILGLESGAVAKILASRANVIVRSGFHCAQPAHDPSMRPRLCVHPSPCTTRSRRSIGCRKKNSGSAIGVSTAISNGADDSRLATWRVL